LADACWVGWDRYGEEALAWRVGWWQQAVVAGKSARGLAGWDCWRLLAGRWGSMPRRTAAGGAGTAVGGHAVAWLAGGGRR
jgi:hypothetical protein